MSLSDCGVWKNACSFLIFEEFMMFEIGSYIRTVDCRLRNLLQRGVFSSTLKIYLTHRRCFHMRAVRRVPFCRAFLDTLWRTYLEKVTKKTKLLPDSMHHPHFISGKAFSVVLRLVSAIRYHFELGRISSRVFFVTRAISEHERMFREVMTRER